MDDSSTSTRHGWQFFRAGGFDQVRLDRGADLARLSELDQKLWVALACPAQGLEFDGKTLELIDTDKDGRIRAPELLAAVRWAVGILKSPDELVNPRGPLPLASINEATEEGEQLLRSARQILGQLGKGEAAGISLADVQEMGARMSQTRFNGDGVVTPGTAEDGGMASLIEEIMGCVGSELDRSGKAGVNQAKIEQFYGEAQAYLDWLAKGEAGGEVLRPLGEGTAAAVAAWRAVRVKVEDYFARCRLAAFDSRAMLVLNGDEKELAGLASTELKSGVAEVSGFPLARVEPGRALPLVEGLNPAWSGAVGLFRAGVVKPLLGERTVLTEAEWGVIEAKLGAYEAWEGSKAGGALEKLGVGRVTEILAGTGKERLLDLVGRDKALEGEFNSVAAVEKLVRFRDNLHRLCVNFVNFSDFYRAGSKAVFQVGTLYLDQRSCELCMPVEDVAKHTLLAGMAGAYLAYCDCVRKGTGEKLQMVAAFTNGDSDHLMVGRNGVFYDRRGRDWDATITKVVENPISIREAFWSPYKKLVRLIEEMSAKRAAAAEAQSSARMEATAGKVAEADKVAAKPAEPRKVDVGTVAALGVAFGAIGAFMAAVWGHLMGIVTLGPLAIIGGFVGLMLLISGPAMFIAFLKLRKRNLGPILDANGWAVNARARINVPFGASLTRVAALPPGAHRDLRDPYAEKRSPWPRVIGLVVVLWIAYTVLNGMGYIHEWSGGRIGVPRVVNVAPEVAVPAEASPPAEGSAPVAPAEGGE
jgi:hypothetical protein